MFVVDDILVSDALVDAPFACDTRACLGGCCVQGSSGAPLEPEERAVLEELLPVVRDQIRPEALEVIDKQGVWEEVSPGHFATTCVGGAECVFVTYDGPIARCAIQNAYRAGQLDFEKPISCHLFPVRVEKYGEFEALNYERIDLCEPARENGCRLDVQVSDYLRAPLVRKYGESWYERFLEAVEARRVAPPRGSAQTR